MSTDKTIQTNLQKELDDREITIDELQDELKEKLAYVQILTVKDLKERGHNFHPCKYTKIVCTDESTGSYVVFNEAYSNKTVPIEIVDKGTLTFTLYNYDTTKCSQINKSHQDKLVTWTAPDTAPASVKIDGNVISNMKFEYIYSSYSTGKLSVQVDVRDINFQDVIQLFLMAMVVKSVFLEVQKHKISIPTCRHNKTLSIDVYPKFKAKISGGFGVKSKSVNSTTVRRSNKNERIIRIKEISEEGETTYWFLGFEATLGDLTFELKSNDPVIDLVKSVSKSVEKIHRIQEQLVELTGEKGVETTIKKTTLDITFPTIYFGGEVESVGVGIKRKYNWTLTLGAKPLIGIIFKVDLLAFAAKAAGPWGILIEIRDYCKRKEYGDLFCDLSISGEISGIVEIGTQKRAATISGKISVSIELGLKITLKSIDLQASAKASGGIQGEIIFSFTSGITIEGKIGNDDLKLSAIFKVKLKVVFEFNYSKTFDFTVLKKDTLSTGFGPNTIA